MFNNKQKTVVLILLVFVMVSIAIAYSALYTTLNIGGTVDAPSVQWDVHFINFSDSTPSSPNTGEIKNVTTSNTAITNLTADLKKPGDSVVYSFDIKNFGNIDARLTSFTSAITCPSNDCSYATYTVQCLNGATPVTQGFVLAKNASINCSLTVTYKTGVTIQDDAVTNVSANWNFVQN